MKYVRTERFKKAAAKLPQEIQAKAAKAPLFHGFTACPLECCRSFAFYHEIWLRPEAALWLSFRRSKQEACRPTANRGR